MQHVELAGELIEIDIDFDDLTVLHVDEHDAMCAGTSTPRTACPNAPGRMNTRLWL
jgi:hypothetical protein